MTPAVVSPFRRRPSRRLARIANVISLAAWSIGYGPIGCGPFDSATDGRGSEYADAAVVHNDSPRWSTGHGWRIADAPSVTVGGSPTDPRYQLHMVADALQLVTGDLVIANWSSRELRFYDRTGAYRFAVGGEGGGPGEFESIDWIDRFGGDSLVVWDSRLQRMSFFDRHGGYGRSVPIRATDQVLRPQPRGVFDDGTFLVTDPDVPENPFDMPDGPRRDVLRLYRFASDGMTIFDSLGWVWGSESYVLHDGPRIVGAPSPFSRSTQLLVRGDRYYVATNDTYEITVFTQTGGPRRIIRKRHRLEPLTNYLIQDTRKSWEEGLTTVPERIRPARRRIAERVPFPPTLPAYGASPPRRGVHLDSDHNLWVREYTIKSDTSEVWAVFGPAGRWLGSVTFPGGFEPFDIGYDYVVGRARDDLDVEHVLRFNLIKGPG